MHRIIKILISILLLTCLLKMPYGYFNLVRIVCVFGFTILAYDAKRKSENIEVIIYVGLALLFQPFVKIALGRLLWNIVDVIVAFGLMLSMFKARKSD